MDGQGNRQTDEYPNKNLNETRIQSSKKMENRYMAEMRLPNLELAIKYIVDCRSGHVDMNTVKSVVAWLAKTLRRTHP